MRILSRIAVASAVLSLGLAAGHPAASRADCPAFNPARQVCLSEPDVSHPTADTNVFFDAGVWVSVQADGCVQTGGSGATWKRYVDPDPPVSGAGPANHFGSLAIVSRIGGPDTISLARLFDISPVVRFRVTTPSQARVAYKDDANAYGDNGYTAHDNGSGNQCLLPSGPRGYGGSAYILFTVDPNTPPTAQLAAVPAFVGAHPAFQGFGDDPADHDLPFTFTFLVDNQSIQSGAGNTATWNGSTEGHHTVQVRVTDRFGASTSSATQGFTVDTTPPVVQITGGPDGTTFGPGSAQTWTFTAADGAGSGVKSIQCLVDDQPVACTAAGSDTVANLPQGTHKFSVKAADNLGNVSAPVSRSVTIDAAPPDTTITGGPAEGTTVTDQTVSFLFSATKEGSRFECQAYLASPAPLKPGFRPCSAGSAHVLQALVPASYVFEVRAVDTLGNADPTPAARHFAVVAPPPPPPRRLRRPRRSRESRPR